MRSYWGFKGNVDSIRPFTTGEITFVSSQIPDELKDLLIVNLGGYNSRQTNCVVGDSGKQLGVHGGIPQLNSGFKTLDGGNAGFDLWLHCKTAILN
jgi:hypothetical protein